MAMTIDAFNNTEQWAIEQWGQADLGLKTKQIYQLITGKIDSPQQQKRDSP